MSAAGSCIGSLIHAVVERDGKSPRWIAGQLNEEGTPSPGVSWNRASERLNAKPYLVARVGIKREVVLQVAAGCLESGSGGRIYEYPQEEGAPQSGLRCLRERDLALIFGAGRRGSG